MSAASERIERMQQAIADNEMYMKRLNDVAHACTVVRDVMAWFPEFSPEWKLAFDARHNLLDLFDAINGR